MRLRQQRRNCPTQALAAVPAIITITVQVALVAIVIVQDHQINLQREPAQLERLGQEKALDPHYMVGATQLLSLVGQAMLIGLSVITFQVLMATRQAAAI